MEGVAKADTTRTDENVAVKGATFRRSGNTKAEGVFRLIAHMEARVQHNSDLLQRSQMEHLCSRTSS